MDDVHCAGQRYRYTLIRKGIGVYLSWTTCVAEVTYRYRYVYRYTLALDDMHCYPVMPSMLPAQLQSQYNRSDAKQSASKRKRSTAVSNLRTDECGAPPSAIGGGNIILCQNPNLGGGCVHCLDAPAETVFVHGDSGHRCFCAGCAEKWKRSRRRDCPICRRHVDRVIRLYDSAVYDE